MKFCAGQKVWDKYAGKSGVVTSIVNDDYYHVDEGFGSVLCLERDLSDYDTATTFRNGKVIRVTDIEDD